jgi:hypothetical protein
MVDPAFVELFKVSAGGIAGIIGTLSTRWLQTRFSGKEKGISPISG